MRQILAALACLPALLWAPVAVADIGIYDGDTPRCTTIYEFEDIHTDGRDDDGGWRRSTVRKHFGANVPPDLKGGNEDHWFFSSSCNNQHSFTVYYYRAYIGPSNDWYWRVERKCVNGGLSYCQS